MIGKLRGVVDFTAEDFVILDVGGVGYEVHCSTRVLGSLPAVGETVTLAIETHVRETEIRLFGFSSEVERRWFRLLQSVQGVGAKSALALLSVLTPADLTNAIALQDKAMVARAPGVGPKVAQRIVTELQNKAPALTAGSGDPSVAGGGGAGTSVGDGAGSGDAGGSGVIDVPSGAHAADAISALVNLGYQPAHAASAISAAMKNAASDATTEDLIRLGLKELAR
ncbi:MAG: Holliday junction branch migration protein RuvA [Pseudomonadota bacterium]